MAAGNRAPARASTGSQDMRREATPNASALSRQAPCCALRYSPLGRPGALVPVPPGARYRLANPPAAALVRPALAAQLQRVLERFAAEAGATPARPVAIEFRPGVVGHHQVGRAADLYAVGGGGLAGWKRRWDTDLRAALHQPDRDLARLALARMRAGNLGWRLYRALQCHGRWAQPYGYPIQLFGPWTRDEGPWRFVSDKLLHAHRDHIHVAL